MIIDLDYLLISMFFFVVFVIIASINIIKLRGVLKHNVDANELKKIKWIKQPYLLMASITALLSIMFLSLSLFKPQMPLIITLSVEYFYFRNVVYHSDLELIWDFLFVASIMAVSNIYLIMKSQDEIESWFEFWIGFIFGCVFMFTLQPLFLPLFIIGAITILSLLILLLPRFGIKEAMGYIGFFIGAGFMLIFPPSTNSLIFWLSLALGIGIAIGSFYLFGFRLFILAVPSIVIIILIILSNFTLGATLLLGAVTAIMFVLDIRTIYKIAVITPMSLTYAIVLSMIYPPISFGIVFITGIVLIQWIIAELYKNTVRKVFINWVLSRVQSTKNNDKIDLSEHETIPDFKATNIDSKSYRFKWLNYLVLKPLKDYGFDIEVVKEKKDNLEYIRGIFACPRKG